MGCDDVKAGDFYRNFAWETLLLRNDPEEGGSIFIRNICYSLHGYTVHQQYSTRL